MARVVSRDVFQILQAIVKGFWENDSYIDKNIREKVEQVKAKETPNVIKDKEREVTYSSKTIPEEGRVVVKGTVKVNEGEALRIAKQKAKQKENMPNDINR